MISSVKLIFEEIQFDVLFIELRIY